MATFAPIAQLAIGSATVSENFSMSAESGTYALSMHGAAKLITDIYPSGSYLLNGRAVDLKVGYYFATDAGQFTLTGTDAETENRTDDGKILLDRNYGFPILSGSFALTGNTVEIDTGFGLVTETAEYDISTFAANLNVRFSAPSGQFTLTGQSVTKDISEIAESGSFTVTGDDAFMFANRPMVADAGSFNTSVFDIKIRGYLSFVASPKIYQESASLPSDIWAASDTTEEPSWTEAA